MKLQYASDLHLEFPENKEFLMRNPLKPEGDILVLAGDIVPFARMNDHPDFFDYLSDNFELTYWIPGNHEYYRSDINERSGHLNEKIRENILLVNNTTVIKGKIKLIFSTLWTKISLTNQFEIQALYSDFHIIRDGNRVLDVYSYNYQHDQCVAFLEKELSAKRSGTTVIVTHHMPTFINYPEEYKGEILNEAFASELSGLIKETTPGYWIFGHHHRNKGDFNIGETRLITNQLGYVIYHEQKGFGSGKYVSL